MKEKLLQKLQNMNGKQLKKRIILLYIVVVVVAGIFFVFGKLNLIEIILTYAILACCIMPVLKL